MTCRPRPSRPRPRRLVSPRVRPSRRSMSPESRSTPASRARAFAGYMRIHALESSGGLTYAQMGRYATADGKPAGTNDPALAQKGTDGEPVANAARNTWVTETALATALNVSYMAERTALFGIVVGIALLLVRHRLRDPRDRRSAAQSRAGVRPFLREEARDARLDRVTTDPTRRPAARSGGRICGPGRCRVASARKVEASSCLRVSPKSSRAIPRCAALLDARDFAS